MGQWVQFEVQINQLPSDALLTPVNSHTHNPNCSNNKTSDTCVHVYTGDTTHWLLYFGGYK